MCIWKRRWIPKSGPRVRSASTRNEERGCSEYILKETGKKGNDETGEQDINGMRKEMKQGIEQSQKRPAHE